MIRIDPLTIRAVTDGAPVVSRTLTLASPVRAIGGAGKRRARDGEFSRVTFSRHVMFARRADKEAAQ